MSDKSFHWFSLVFGITVASASVAQVFTSSDLLEDRMYQSNGSWTNYDKEYEVRISCSLISEEDELRDPMNDEIIACQYSIWDQRTGRRYNGGFTKRSKLDRVVARFENRPSKTE